MKNNPYMAYKEQSFKTMTPCDMLTALYDGILKELSGAKIAYEKKDYTLVNKKLQKSQLILKHLQRTLDFKYPISNNLNSLYDYFLHNIVQSNMKKDPALLDDVITMIGELRSTYIEADKKNRSNQ